MICIISTYIISIHAMDTSEFFALPYEPQTPQAEISITNEEGEAQEDLQKLSAAVALTRMRECPSCYSSESDTESESESSDDEIQPAAKRRCTREHLPTSLIIKCPHCQKTLSSQNFEEHKRRFHPAHIHEPVVCRRCHRVFKGPHFSRHWKRCYEKPEVRVWGKLEEAFRDQKDQTPQFITYTFD